MTPYDQALWNSGKEKLAFNGKKTQKQAQGGAGERKSKEKKKSIRRQNIKLREGQDKFNDIPQWYYM